MDGRLHFFPLLTNISDDKHTWERPAQAFELAKYWNLQVLLINRKSHAAVIILLIMMLLFSPVAYWGSGFGFLTWGSKDNCDCNRHCINQVELNHPIATPAYHKLSNISERVSVT